MQARAYQRTHTGTIRDAFTIVAIVDALRKPVTSKTAAEGRSFTVDVIGERFVVCATDGETIQQLIDNYNSKNSISCHRQACPRRRRL